MQLLYLAFLLVLHIPSFCQITCIIQHLIWNRYYKCAFDTDCTSQINSVLHINSVFRDNIAGTGIWFLSKITRAFCVDFCCCLPYYVISCENKTYAKCLSIRVFYLVFRHFLHYQNIHKNIVAIDLRLWAL